MGDAAFDIWKNPGADACLRAAQAGWAVFLPSADRFGRVLVPPLRGSDWIGAEFRGLAPTATRFRGFAATCFRGFAAAAVGDPLRCGRCFERGKVVSGEKLSAWKNCRRGNGAGNRPTPRADWVGVARAARSAEVF
jgi:hypothetical protein